MRILYLYQYFGTPKGGWSTRVYEFTRRWVKDGHKVTVVTAPYDKSDILKRKGLWYTMDVDGIRVVVINLPQSNKHAKLHRIYTFFAFSLLSIYFALRIPSDIVIASSGPISIGLPALAARYLRGIPMVFEVRDLWPEGAIQLGILKNQLIQSIAYWFEKQCYLASEAIITCSVDMSAWINERYGFDHIHVIPNSSDNDLFGSIDCDFVLPEWAKNKKLVIYAGSLGYMDDAMQIIQAAKELLGQKRDDIVFVMLGDGADRTSMESYAKYYGLHVHFLGLCPKTTVVNWLNHADCTLLVMRDVRVLDTCSPNKFFDYLAASKPVVQTTQGWIKRVLEKCKAGVTVPPGKPEQMAEAIKTIVDNDNMSRSMGKRAKMLALSHFDRDMLSNKMLHVLRDCQYLHRKEQ